MKIGRILLLALALATGVPDGLTQTKRALVMGLGEQMDPSWQKINGDRDVPLVESMLRQNGFKDITTLVNAKATKQAIVKNFSRLASKCKPGDIVYIHFSGHGQKMSDVESDETDDPWDEAWIPYDAYRTYGLNDHGEKHLSDDEVDAMLTVLSEKVGSTGAVVVAVDACHSGDATRGPRARLTAVRGVRDRFIIPEGYLPRSRMVQERDTQPWLTLSACRDYQLNAEHPDGYGSLTAALCSLWPQFDAETDNQTLLKAVAAHIRKSGIGLEVPQTPQIDGNDAISFAIIFKPLSK
ncbi:MAG: caspase family protein [Muribaculaceae bacterium]|nr:caspase family protein [Muribaculaceae bacterium]